MKILKVCRKSVQNYMNNFGIKNYYKNESVRGVIYVISSEFQKGLNSDFNVSEAEINNLGYEFVR